MIIDPLSDFLTRVRNAQTARHPTMRVPASRLKKAVAHILEKEGFVDRVSECRENGRPLLEITLKYQGKMPWIRHVQRVSKPGRRVYRKAHELSSVLSGQGIAVISTSVGVLSSREARRRRLGGEILCEVW